MHIKSPNNSLAKKLHMYKIFLILMLACASVHAESDAVIPPAAEMNTDLIEKIVMRLDPEYVREGSMLAFQYADLELTIVTDENADRMRVVIPIAETAGINKDILVRIMQANFDSALDARYAIGQGILWSTFLHRLSSLSPEDLLSGIGQSINIVKTFGTSFSSGALTFGGGDSNEIHRALIDELLKRGQAI